MTLRHSGVQSADATITQVGGILGGVTLHSPATACSVVVSDCVLAASVTDANTLAIVRLAPGNGAYGTQHWEPSEPVKYTNGLFCNVSGTNATYIVYYKKG